MLSLMDIALHITRSTHSTYSNMVTIVPKSWELSAEKYLSVKVLSVIEEEII